MLALEHGGWWRPLLAGSDAALILMAYLLHESQHLLTPGWDQRLQMALVGAEGRWVVDGLPALEPPAKALSEVLELLVVCLLAAVPKEVLWKWRPLH